MGSNGSAGRGGVEVVAPADGTEPHVATQVVVLAGEGAASGTRKMKPQVAPQAITLAVDGTASDISAGNHACGRQNRKWYTS